MQGDLSRYHQPLSGFLESSPPLSGPLLSDQQVTEFHEKGFISGIEILSEDQVDKLLKDLAVWLDPDYRPDQRWHEYHSNESGDPEQVLFHALGAWRSGPAYHDLLWHPSVISAAEQLLDGPVRFWHDQLFCKPPGHGGGVSWHQDYSYWTRTAPIGHLTCWLALDDANASNGSIQYVPGSHRWNLLPITGLAGQMDAIRDVLDDDQWTAMQNPEAITVKRGSCSFHHPLTVHGSERNNSDHPRRATVLNLAADGCKSMSDEPLLSGVPVIPNGTPLSGQFFPLLSSS